jgi:hypothetical protein
MSLLAAAANLFTFSPPKFLFPANYHESFSFHRTLSKLVPSTHGISDPTFCKSFESFWYFNNNNSDNNNNSNNSINNVISYNKYNNQVLCIKLQQPQQNTLT